MCAESLQISTMFSYNVFHVFVLVIPIWCGPIAIHACFHASCSLYLHKAVNEHCAITVIMNEKGWSMIASHVQPLLCAQTVALSRSMLLALALPCFKCVIDMSSNKFMIDTLCSSHIFKSGVSSKVTAARSQKTLHSPGTRQNVKLLQYFVRCVHIMA